MSANASRDALRAHLMARIAQTALENLQEA